MSIRSLLARLTRKPIPTDATPRLTVVKAGSMTDHDVYKAVCATAIVTLRDSGPFIAALTLRESHLHGRPPVIRGEVFHADNARIVIDTYAIDPAHVARLDIY